jgi:hypothetical protein
MATNKNSGGQRPVTKTIKSAPPLGTSGWGVAALLAIILALLFWRSFLPGYVHFSNDGPLGQQMTAWSQVPQAFTGAWDDMNDIGWAAGAYPLGIGALLHWTLGPLGYAKYLAPVALFVLGMGAWAFFRQLNLSPLAALLGALAAALNSALFATACWGVAPQEIAIGMDFFAMALVVSNTVDTPLYLRCTRLALAGLAVGVNIMEASDIGAILSLLVAAFVFFKALADESGPVLVKAARGVGRVAVVALFAAFLAAQTVVTLVGSQIHGVVGMGQDTESKAQHWDWATQWSLPKLETIGLFVPGVFGYKYDTPENMMDFLQNSYVGGVYWGLVGCDPSWDDYFAHGEPGPPPPSSVTLRFAGGQNYAGILVALLALWAIAQSLRGPNSVFPLAHRPLIWFWTAVLIVSLLLAWGRFAPFYQWVYLLPYFSTIRNPAKFLIPFTFAIVTLFACAVDALSRSHLAVPATGPVALSKKFKDWWRKAGRFDRYWVWFCAAAFVVSVIAWLVYAARQPALVNYLEKAGFPDADMAKQMAAFSVRQVEWFLLLFALAIGLALAVLAGLFSGPRARWGGLLLGALLVVDLGRADLPYITHWDYMQKYDIDPGNPRNSTDPIINFLRDKPYEHRVAKLPFTQSQSLFDEVYDIEWMQHHFPYYNIQSLDIVQRPRVSADLAAYALALAPAPGKTYETARHWELTNTRYLLGQAGYLDGLNQQLDPEQHRFRIVQRFSIALKPGIDQFTKLEELTTAPDTNGEYALFEFTGALPRAKLYADWQTNSVADLQHFTTNGLDELDWTILDDAGTNDFLALKKLASASFDPQQTVLLSAPLPEAEPNATTNRNAGSVEFWSYSPKTIELATQSSSPAVLLLNDKYDEHWRVTVDGQPAPLLRCNFIMRGVYVPAGAHTVVFRFALSHKPLYVTLAAMVVGVLLCGILLASTRRGRNGLGPERSDRP